jgi:hypothetical protein
LRKNPILAQEIVKKKYLVYLVIGLVCITNLVIRGHSNLTDWDEGVFALQAEWIASLGAAGAPFNFQTPPLFQVIVALFFRLLGVHDFLMTLISITFSCLTILIVYHLGKMLYSEEIGLYAIAFFVTSEYFLFFSQSGLSDATFTFFSTGSLFFFLRALRSNRTRDFWIAGLLTTFCLYTKYSAAPIIIAFFIIGILNRYTINRHWFVTTIVLPLIIFVPYISSYLLTVSPAEIGVRHIPLLGLNHLKYTYYLLILAPVPFVHALIHTCFGRRHHDKFAVYLLIAVIVFFVILGFYHPYFRLAYPLVPLLSIFAGSLVASLRKPKYYILAVSIFAALTLSLRTLRHTTKAPRDVASIVDQYTITKDTTYIYSLTPPNIYFYINGEIAVHSTHTWYRIGKRFPWFLRSRLILEKETNMLSNEKRILLVHATIFDTFKDEYPNVYDKAMLVDNIDYQDAPVYYKDIFNPLRNFQQSYEFYLLSGKDILQCLDQLWNLGFEREVKVIYVAPPCHE